jgi:hypothetical protein
VTGCLQPSLLQNGVLISGLQSHTFGLPLGFQLRPEGGMGVDRIVDVIRGWLLPELAAEALDQLLVDAPRAVLARWEQALCRGLQRIGRETILRRGRGGGLNSRISPA